MKKEWGTRSPLWHSSDEKDDICEVKQSTWISFSIKIWIRGCLRHIKKAVLSSTLGNDEKSLISKFKGLSMKEKLTFLKQADIITYYFKKVYLYHICPDSFYKFVHVLSNDYIFIFTIFLCFGIPFFYLKLCLSQALVSPDPAKFKITRINCIWGSIYWNNSDGQITTK